LRLHSDELGQRCQKHEKYSMKNLIQRFTVAAIPDLSRAPTVN